MWLSKGVIRGNDYERVWIWFIQQMWKMMHVVRMVTYDKDLDVANKRSKWKYMIISWLLKGWRKALILGYESIMCIYKYECVYRNRIWIY